MLGESGHGPCSPRLPSHMKAYHIPGTFPAAREEHLHDHPSLKHQGILQVILHDWESDDFDLGK